MRPVTTNQGIPLHWFRCYSGLQVEQMAYTTTHSSEETSTYKEAQLGNLLREKCRNADPLQIETGGGEVGGNHECHLRLGGTSPPFPAYPRNYGHTQQPPRAGHNQHLQALHLRNSSPVLTVGEPPPKPRLPVRKSALRVAAQMPAQMRSRAWLPSRGESERGRPGTVQGVAHAASCVTGAPPSRRGRG